MKAIANKQADVAAIDEVVWNLAFDYEPAVDRLRVIGKTPVSYTHLTLPTILRV